MPLSGRHTCLAFPLLGLQLLSLLICGAEAHRFDRIHMPIYEYDTRSTTPVMESTYDTTEVPPFLEPTDDTTEVPPFLEPTDDTTEVPPFLEPTDDTVVLPPATTPMVRIAELSYETRATTPMIRIAEPTSHVTPSADSQAAAGNDMMGFSCVAAAQLDVAERTAVELLLGWTAEPAATGAASKWAALKFARDINAFEKKLVVAVSLYNYVSSTLLASESDDLPTALVTRFRTVNRKLNMLESHMQLVTHPMWESGKEMAELAPYHRCHHAVHDGAKKLSEVFESLEDSVVKKKDLSRLVHGYISWHSASGLDADVRQLHRALSRDPGLFTVFSERYHACNTHRLIDLLLRVSHDLQLGAELSLAARIFSEGPHHVDDLVEKFAVELYQVRSAFEAQYWRCTNNLTVWAATAAGDALRSAAGSEKTPVELAALVLATLEGQFHRFHWALAVGVKKLLPSSLGEAGNFFYAMFDSGPPLLAMFTDTEQQLQCADAPMTSSVMVFNCPDDTCAIAATPGGPLTSRLCPGVSVPGARDETQWMASLLTGQDGKFACRVPDACSGHGRCRHRPGLVEPLCQCELAYLGSRCSQRHVALTAAPMQVIATMRDAVGEFIDAETDVDVFYAMQDVSDILRAELHRLTCPDLLKAVANQPVTTALQLADFYGQLLKGQRTAGEFAQLVEAQMGRRDLRQFLLSLSESVLGLQSTTTKRIGIVHLYKTCWSLVEQRQPVCGQAYAEAVESVRDGLVVMDNAVGEALLTYLSWKGDRMTESDRKALSYLTKGYRHRTESYRSFWDGHSCPALTKPGKPLGRGLADWEQRFCEAGHSYLGLRLPVTCSDGMRPWPTYITCFLDRAAQRRRWSARPRCIDPARSESLN